MSACLMCKNPSVADLLSFPPQPISNRFLKDPSGREFLHPMKITGCPACGLVQLTDPVPCAELLPRYDWITYNEPEGHLDDLADIIASLPGISRSSTICGTSFKDDSLLRRMNERGIPGTWRLDPDGDLGIRERSAGVETVQNRISPETARAAATKHGRADIVIARHILEHAYDMQQLLEGLNCLGKKDSYLVIEVPDCERAFRTLNYTTLWEEHLAYFTGATFSRIFPLHGFEILRMERYPYPFEDSLVCISRRTGARSTSGCDSGAAEDEIALAMKFANSFEARAEAIRTHLREVRSREGPVAIFGAGHLTCIFINLFDLASLVDFVVDDNPNKRDLFMPGSRLPIRESSALMEERIRLCLMCLSPESEEKVIRNNGAYTRGGGRFESVIPSSARAMGMMKNASG